MVSEKLSGKIVCFVGLRYVGLPLAQAFAEHLNVIGFDIDGGRIEKLNRSNKADDVRIHHLSIKNKK